MNIEILILMILGHIINYKILKPIILNEYENNKLNYQDKILNKINNKNDNINYIFSIVTYSITWSIIITIPLFTLNLSSIYYTIIVPINMLIHCLTIITLDNNKDNERYMNLYHYLLVWYIIALYLFSIKIE